jgi:trigger factor
MDFLKDFSVETKDATVTISGEVPAAEIAKERPAAIKKLGANVTVDGFRKGHVPEKIIVEKVGEMALLSEMAERALAKVYPEVIKAHDLKVIGHPQIQITKLAPDNPLGFTATVAIMPEITLADYKDIAKNANQDKPTATVTDEDVEKQIKDILRQKVAYERLQQKAAAEASKAEATTDATDLPTPESEAAKQAETEANTEPTDAELPELTDELVQSLGQPGQFTDVADFKTKLREHLTIEKERETVAAHRAKITDIIIDESSFALPDVMIDAEVNQMLAQMNEDLTRANLKLDDYLTHIKKTKEDLIKEWRPAAEKRARLQLILNEIAAKENITPNEAELNEQVKQLMEQHQDADEARVRIYVASVMTNEAVMQMLENQ